MNQGMGQRISVSAMRPISNGYTLDGQDVSVRYAGGGLRLEDVS